MNKLNQLKPIHLNELNLGHTDYGIIVRNADDLQGTVFDNNSSKITLDYDGKFAISKI